MMTRSSLAITPKNSYPRLQLDVQVDLSGKTLWLAEKYDTMLGATVRAIRPLSNEQAATAPALA